MSRKLTVLILTLIFLLPAVVAYADTASSFNVTASGKGFAPNSAVSVTSYNGNTISKTSDGSGAVSFEFSIPSGTKEGVYALRAQGSKIGDPTSTLLLSADFTLKSNAITNVSGTPESSTDEPYAKSYRGPLGLQVVASERAVATYEEDKTSGRTELPYTGGTPLWIMLIAGIVLTTVAFGIKASK